MASHCSDYWFGLGAKQHGSVSGQGALLIGRIYALADPGKCGDGLFDHTSPSRRHPAAVFMALLPLGGILCGSRTAGLLGNRHEAIKQPRADGFCHRHCAALFRVARVQCAGRSDDRDADGPFHRQYDVVDDRGPYRGAVGWGSLYAKPSARMSFSCGPGGSASRL